MEELYFYKVGIDDIFEVYMAHNKPRVRVHINEHAARSLFENRIFYTLFEGKKVFYRVFEGKEYLMGKISYFAGDVSIRQSVLAFIRAWQHSLHDGIEYQEYCESVFKSNYKGLSQKKAAEYIVERPVSESFKWVIKRNYDPDLYRKDMFELLKKELLSNGFKVTIDRTGSTFRKGHSIYFKELAENAYVLFGGFEDIKTFDSRLGYFETQRQIGRSEPIVPYLYSSPGYNWYNRSFICDFRLCIHYPLLKGIIEDPYKYDFFYETASEYDREFIDNMKKLVNWNE